MKKKLKNILILLIFCCTTSIFSAENTVEKNTEEVLKFLNLSTSPQTQCHEQKTDCVERLKRDIEKFFEGEPTLFQNVILSKDIKTFICKITNQQQFFESLLPKIKYPENVVGKQASFNHVLAAVLHDFLSFDLQQKVLKQENFTSVKHEKCYKYYKGMFQGLQLAYVAGIQVDKVEHITERTTLASKQTDESTSRKIPFVLFGALLPYIAYKAPAVPALLAAKQKLKLLLLTLL